jgi:hypothetical protein
MRGEFQPALEYYNQALTSEPKDEAKCALARAGIARTTIQLGDVRRGRQMALESASAQLCRECAAILEGMNHMQVRGFGFAPTFLQRQGDSGGGEAQAGKRETFDIILFWSSQI